MISRYSDPEMTRIWTDESKFGAWLEVEIAVCQVLCEMGQIPSEAMANIRQKARFSVERIREIERITHHDVIAFTTAVAEQVGADSRFIHLGLTSTDVVDTAQALLMRRASERIEEKILRLLATLKQQALRHKSTIIIGRTHGIHAEPTTFGLKLAVWYSEMERNLERFRRARKTLEVGKISGPVGTFSHLPPQVEEAVCKMLGIGFAAASTQTLQRDRHAEYICSLSILASTYDKIATEIRHLQRTEVREAAEPFGKGQKGSSAMPHKRNPIRCEQISGLARVLRSYSVTALENIPLWHERDISHSSAERVILADSTILAHYLTVRLEAVIRDLWVDPERMRQNLALTGGLIYSGSLLLQLVRAGAIREEAYEWVQRNAMRVWQEGADFQQLLIQDSDIRRFLSADQIRKEFNLETRLQHVDTVFQRVFGTD